MRTLVLASVMLAAGCGASEPQAPAAAAPRAAAPEPTGRGAPLPIPPAARGLAAKRAGVLLIEPGGYELGAVKPGSAHEVQVTLRNTGTEPVEIVEAKSTCKCTVPEALKGAVIPAGGARPFKAVFTAQTAPEHKEARIRLVFRAGAQQPQAAEVVIGADVTMPIRAEPPYVDAQKGVTAGTVRVSAADGRPFRIITAGGVAPVYADGYTSGSAPRDAYTLRWELRYPPREADCRGDERLWWIVETDSAACPVLPLRIRHECTGLRADMNYRQRRWIFSEPLVNAELLPAGRPIDLDVDVWRYDGIASTGIDQVRSLSSDATAELVGCSDPQEGDVSTCRVRFTPRAGFRGLLYAMVDFRGPSGGEDIAFVARVVD